MLLFGVFVVAGERVVYGSYLHASGSVLSASCMMQCVCASAVTSSVVGCGCMYACRCWIAWVASSLKISGVCVSSRSSEW